MTEKPGEAFGVDWWLPGYPPDAFRKLVRLDIHETQRRRMGNGQPSVPLTDSRKPDIDRYAEKWRRVSGRLLTSVLLPAAVAFGLLYRQEFAVPYQDDYPVIVDFANDYSQLHGFTAKLLDIATKQNNDYKLGFVHFIVAMEMEFAGHLNFPFLVNLGNLSLIFIAYLLWRVYRSDGSDINGQLMGFIPISALFFSFTYWETLDWAMAGLQNLPVILFSLLAVCLLIPKPGVSPSPLMLFLSCVSGMLAAFSSANGFLLAPVGLLILLRRRDFAASVAWCASFVVPVAAYVYHYTPFYVSVEKMHRGSYVAKLEYFFAFLGCAIPSRFAAAFLGLVISAVLLLALQSRVERTNPVPFYFTLWILLTAGLVAWLRQSIAPRYSIYSVLLLIFCYWFLAKYVPSRLSAFTQKRFYVASIILAVSFFSVRDRRAYAHLAQRRQMVLAGMEHYRANPEVNPPTIDPVLAKYFPDEPDFERATLNRAIQLNVYTLPSNLSH
jgi:hypothetical protein